MYVWYVPIQLKNEREFCDLFRKYIMTSSHNMNVCMSEIRAMSINVLL